MRGLLKVKIIKLMTRRLSLGRDNDDNYVFRVVYLKRAARVRGGIFLLGISGYGDDDITFGSRFEDGMRRARIYYRLKVFYER